MEALGRLRVFHKVVLNQSFTKAAQELRLTRSMVSQHVRLLEEELGVTLLLRTTRSMNLTEDGRKLFDACEGMFAQWEGVLESLQETTRTPSGHLRLTAPVDMGTGPLARIIPLYRERFPDVSLEVHLDDAVLNIVEEGFDLSIRVGWMKDSSLRATKIADFEPVVCAAPDFPGIRQLKKPADLVEVPWVVLSILPNPYRWTFTGRHGNQTTIKLPRSLTTNSPAGLKALVMAGAGVGAAPAYHVAEELEKGELVRLLPGHHLPTAGVFAVWPGGDPPLRVRAFIELLREEWQA